MNRQGKICLAIACLALVVVACRLVTGSPVIFSDDFSSLQWGTTNTENHTVQYENNALQVIVNANNLFVWSMPNAETYQNIHIEVKVTDNGTDPNTAFGVICNKQASTENFHYLAITPNGQYAIARATEGQSDFFLTNNDSWGSSDLVPRDAAAYHIGADCGNGLVTLYVDGQQVASVSDSTYASGQVGVMVWSAKQASATDVSFDDFLMTELP